MAGKTSKLAAGHVRYFRAWRLTDVLSESMPGRVCSGTHAEEAVARRCRRGQSQQRPAAELHHCLTQKFLSGLLHDELIRFADGAPMSS